MAIDPAPYGTWPAGTGASTPDMLMVLLSRPVETRENSLEWLS
jgi:hypothetical protein